jgi:hypothetical protein
MGKDTSTKISVNPPVRNLNTSVAVFTKLDFSFNPSFADEVATCMIMQRRLRTSAAGYYVTANVMPHNLAGRFG